MTDWRPLLIPLLLGAVLCVDNYSRDRQAKGYVPRGRFPLFVSRISFLTSFAGLTVCTTAIALRHYTVSLAIVLVLTLTVGFGLLLLLLPLFRRILSAESCATLWVIPVFLLMYSGTFPRWCITLPFAPPDKRIVFVLAGVWFAGFAAVLIWSILTHLIFRHRLLKNARPVADEMYQQVWQKQLMVANLPEGKLRWCMTPDTQTPLSIGLFWRTTYLVLPERRYSPEELGMVLQHELIHISRRDSVMKFFMSLWAALLWFNPLAWIALRVCAQDLELSCDETVLYGRPELARKAYAGLVLHTASNQMGFTSCLSASASSLRYRLKNIVTHHKRITGSIVIGLLSFAMLLGGMFVGVRYQAVPANTVLFAESDSARLQVGQMIFIEDGADVAGGECEKDQILLDYIATLSLQKTSEKPDVYSADRHIQIIVHAPNSNYMLTFSNGYLRVYTTSFGDTPHMEMVFYRLESDLDWQFLLSCIAAA